MGYPIRPVSSQAERILISASKYKLVHMVHDNGSI